MDGKEESLWTNRNYFLDLHDCHGKPPDKAVTFLMVWRRHTLIKEILRFSVSILMFHSECMVLLNLKHKILCSWFLSHHSYSDFIYHVIEIPSSYLHFEIQKLSKATFEFGNQFDEHYVHQKWSVGVSGVSAWKGIW